MYRLIGARISVFNLEYRCQGPLVALLLRSFFQLVGTLTARAATCKWESGRGLFSFSGPYTTAGVRAYGGYITHLSYYMICTSYCDQTFLQLPRGRLKCLIQLA